MEIDKYMNIIYLDTETTGLKPGQICELSLIKESDFNFEYAKNYFFEVDEVESGAENVHGFSVEMLKQLSGGKKFSDYKDEILNELEGSTLVAHNLPFDEKFISTELWRCECASFTPADRVDTMVLFKPILKIPAKSRRYGPYKSPKLSEVMDYLNINADVVSQHTAKWFSDSTKTSYHDSRYDTACLYVITNVYREKLHSTIGYFTKTFCN